MKYKGIVLEYKEKRDREKLAIKNNYRFNEEVLTHCQNIIKGANKWYTLSPIQIYTMDL